MTLPNDYTRCQGINCGIKETCARYVLRTTGGERTLHTDRFCGVVAGRIVDGFIPMEEGDE